MSKTIASFKPSPLELALTEQIFNQADPDKIGIITGDAAVKFFSGSNLPPTTLGEIWSLADSDNNGWLTQKGVAMAVRLIGWAQKGDPVKESLLERAGPLAVIQGISLPAGIAAPKSPPPQRPSPILPPLTPEDRAKYLRLFVTCGPSNGLLAGEKARDVFIKSKLPIEKLGQIWTLADTQSRGSLDSTDFVIGMFLIHACMSSQLPTIPSVLPPGLYEQASGGNKSKPIGSPIRTHFTGGSGGVSSASSLDGFHSQIKPQYTGQTLQYQQTGPLRANVTGSQLQRPQPPSAPTSTWDITPEEKASADRFFEDLDSHKRGYIEGDVAVPFMLQSQLSENVLAQIWDLADLHKDGRLTREGFAVALYLIKGKLAGRDVPDALPPSLVPPSMREQSARSEVHRDLWLLDDTPPSSAGLPSTTSSDIRPQITGSTAYSDARSTPFSSSFPPASNFGADLLGDDDEHSPPSNVPSHSVEIGNVQNQLNSTNRALETVKNERTSIEGSVATSAATLAQLESQLAAAKAAHETETRLLADLRIRSAQQSSTMQSTREDLIRAESDLSALKLEKADVEGALMRDKEEIRELQRKMKDVGEQAEALRRNLEQVKKEARQQKGLLAITKKQLASAETDKVAAARELEEAETEVQELAKELEQEKGPLNTQLPPSIRSPGSRSQSPNSIRLPPSREGSAFSPVSARSNNPFERIVFASSSTPPPSTPVAPSHPFGSLGVDGHGSSSELDGSSHDPFGLDDFVDARASSTAPSQSEAHHSPSPTPSLGAEASVAEKNKEADAEVQLIAPSTHPTPSAPSVDNIISTAETQFPALDIEDEKTETDLPPLQEIAEAEEETSSEEESEGDDDVPLGVLSGRASMDKAKSSEEPANDAAKTPVPASTEAEAAAGAPAPSLSFEDAFGAAFSPSASAPRASSPASQASHASGFDSTSRAGAAPQPETGKQSAPKEDVATKPFGTPFDALPAGDGTSPHPTQAGTTSGLLDFDEAFGSLPGPSSNGDAPFKFDTAFEDNFDFSAATSFTPSQVPSANVTSTNGHSSDQNKSVDVPSNLRNTPAREPSPSVSLPAFQTTPFNQGRENQPSPNPVEGGAKPPTDPSHDAFGMPSSSSPALMLPTRPRPTESSALPAISVPADPVLPPETPPRATSPQIHLPSSASGHNPTSPPATTKSRSSGLRQQSPQQVEPAQRQSKLSLPFHFGRNKKSSKNAAKRGESPVAPAPPPLPSPIRAAGTPAADDDVESVKTLVGMGFTRSQAVAALERHGYDLSSAVNSLLGAQ
ncbi:hypothetical protein BOTBODRAFT_56212 [Botryobasidium botryosum FD-172 SS1]|uniref:UBA domain-containing protein n=1 Tax=Botryobasidium botryosum (strain FD-172 SS1) TaxID=930990 RepID=A0A067MNH2_BOTB1|nr:hypothetical protein BOTBODRAFT_56212 [Botryobasidium botryosum FD-172 SS1]